MPSFEKTLRALNEMKEAGEITEYAVAGAMALVFWVEPVETYDLDVLVFLDEDSKEIVSLHKIYAWANKRGYTVAAEHIMIEGVPVQVVPSPNTLADEAIESAVVIQYGTVAVRVVRPEYLIGLYLQPSARTLKRRERAAALRESPNLDEGLLQDILRRFKLSF
jgi:hypothetical protein